MNFSEIRARFLAFFQKRGHAVIPSASLVTSDERGITNPTLFNSAGMQPLIPFLLGKPHPLGTRLVDVQKCLRTVDIDDIGDKTHATFFEMLGNWSLGDYFKDEAIRWSYEFLTSKSEVEGDKGLGLDPNRLYVTVFEGDSIAPRDQEAVGIWRKVFKEDKKNNVIGADTDTSKGQAGRIFYMPAKNNWWEAGDNGPCGPDSEMFYDVLNIFGGRPITKEEYLAADEARDVVEVWNDVFMQYEKRDGKIVGELKDKCIDTGAGLERLAMVMQGKDNIYETDLLNSIMALAGPMNSSEKSKQRIISDHMRSAVFLIADGVIPSNSFRGYVLRKLIRRAIFSIRDKTIKKEEIAAFVKIISDTYKDSYDNLEQSSENATEIINNEALQFGKTLKQGLREFEKIASASSESKKISGKDAFILFSTYGFPLEITRELAKERKIEVDERGFEAEFKKHQDLSRSGAEQKFKGGLADANDEMVVRYHTATHLLHQALHDVLGDGVGQKGSNITSERLRFDFSYPTKMTDEQKKKVEEIVNEKIAAALPVDKVVMNREEAEKTGARHFFGEKYGDQISIYFVGNNLNSAYSKEFCGGPHVTNTKDLAGPEGKWLFKIVKEEAVAQGIRRIKAVLSARD